MSQAPVLSVKDLKVSYGAIEAVKGISFEIFPREIVSLIGANGAGKTTTLRAISGLIPSREFLDFAAPSIRKHLGPFVKNPESLETENLVKLVSRVKPGFIRVDADEVTYPTHVILRFEIERDLLEDRWPLSELPTVWDEKMKSYLGLSTLNNNKDGCMQDVHWPGGAWGYFPAYTFGAVIAAQLFATASRLHPNLKNEISQGNFSGLQGWLRENIWSQGSRLNTLQLVEQASGPLTVESFRKHLEARYLGT